MPLPNNAAKLFENFEEVVKPEECVVKGGIPAWLSVTLVRNGPGMFTIGDTEYKHWFDGLAFIQRYYLNDQKMFYSAKYLKSNAYKRNMSAQRIVVSEFGTTSYPDPCKSIFTRYFNHLFDNESTDNALVNFLQAGDEVYATTETPYMYKIDMKTLDTYDRVDVSNYVAVNFNTAHQHYDEEGNIYNIGSKFGKNGQYVFTKMENPKINNSQHAEKMHKIGSIPFDNNFHPSYYHSFGMTKNYMILFESPMRINVYKLLVQKFTGLSVRETFEWDNEKLTNIYILDKNTGNVLPITYQSKPFFTFHHANSYEKDGFLIVDYCKYEKADTLEFLSMAEMRNGAISLEAKEEHKPYLHRMVIPLNIPENAKAGINLLEKKNFSGKCTAVLENDSKILLSDERLCVSPFEFPRYHYGFNTKPYKYVYGATFLSNDLTLPGVVKSNVNDRSYKIWRRDHIEQICSEPVFVPRPGGVEEDDGVILCPILTTREGDRPFLLILDAKTMSEQARCYVEHPLPPGFHAHFVENKNL